MSSGACRALVSVLLTLIAAAVMVTPVAAETQRINEISRVKYEVDPRTGQIDVETIITLRSATSRQVPPGEYGPIIVEDRTFPAQPRVTAGGQRLNPRFSDLPGPWRAMTVDLDRIAPDERLLLSIRYRIRAGLDDLDSDAAAMATPARVTPGYVYVCVPGQDTDAGSIELQFRGSANFRISQSGTVLQETDQGLASGLDQVAPGELFTCIEASRNGRLQTEDIPGPDERDILLQAWPGEQGWLFNAEANAERPLDAIRAFLDHPIPGDGPVIIRQAPPRDLGGYASDHDTPGIVQLDERAGVVEPEAQLAHAWFSTDQFIELWLREGLAEWTATSLQGDVCAAVDSNVAGVDLADWKVVKPNSDPDTIDQEIADQEAAACGIVSAFADRMSEEQWREVLGSLLNGETKYNGDSGPGVAGTTTVDVRRWLDAVDERGLVPAGKSDPAYAANLDDLDFAQRLVEEFGADVNPVELVERSEARAYYHQFLNDAAPLSAPLAVRKAMEDWDFRTATAMLDKSYEVWNALQEAIALLPEADIFPIIAPDFEAAPDAAALDAVLAETLTLLDETSGVVGPLSELAAVAPAGWDYPAAVRRAISSRRFNDIISAIGPSLDVVRRVKAADSALPQAGILATYKPRYENATTTTDLSRLADEAGADERRAVQTGRALEQLQTRAGDWRIPSAVTEPVDAGQLSVGLTIVNDALAVVNAAQEADQSLPRAELAAEIQPRFEAVESGGEMAVLRDDAEELRDQAVAIGSALGALEQRVPEWRIPAVVTDPIEARDFAVAAEVASTAEAWIENAWEAQGKLPALDAINRAQVDFESAQTLAELQSGAARAENWNIVAGRVAAAQDKYDEPRDLLTNFGLVGTDVKGPLDQAIEAAIQGDVDTAQSRALTVLDLLNDAPGAGSLRLAGIVFLIIALLGVFGLWVMLRREAGPPWARQTTPHWVEQKPSRWRLGSGAKTEGEKKK